MLQSDGLFRFPVLVIYLHPCRRLCGCGSTLSGHSMQVLVYRRLTLDFDFRVRAQSHRLMGVVRPALPASTHSPMHLGGPFIAFLSTLFWFGDSFSRIISVSFVLPTSRDYTMF